MNYDLAEMVSKGLEDSWSEIRYAASLAVRSFYEVAKDNKEIR